MSANILGIGGSSFKSIETKLYYRSVNIEEITRNINKHNNTKLSVIQRKEGEQNMVGRSEKVMCTM